MDACVPNGWPPSIYSTGCGGCATNYSSTPVTLSYGPQIDAFGRLRVSQPFTLFDSQQRYELDDNFVSNTASGGTVTYLATQSSANLTVTGTIGSYAARETKWVFSYQPGKSLLALCSLCLAPKSSGNLVQRVGYFGSENGIFLELSDQVYIVKRSNVTGVITETRVAQTDWSNDPLNGYGPSGVTLDPTKVQLIWFDFEWLGVGNVRTGFVFNGQFVVTHVFQHTNYASTTYITTACLPVRYEIQTLLGSAPATSNLTQICSTVISEGGYDQGFRLFSNVNTFSRVMTAGTWYPVQSIRLTQSRLDAIVQVRQIDITMTSADTLHWALWSNVSTDNLTGENFVAHSHSLQVEIDNSATAMTTTGCIQIAAGLVSGTNQAVAPIEFDLAKYYSQLGRDSFAEKSKIITLTLYSVLGVGGGGASAQTLLSWNELL